MSSKALQQNNYQKRYRTVSAEEANGILISLQALIKEERGSNYVLIGINEVLKALKRFSKNPSTTSTTNSMLIILRKSPPELMKWIVDTAEINHIPILIFPNDSTKKLKQLFKIKKISCFYLSFINHQPLRSLRRSIRSLSTKTSTTIITATSTSTTPSMNIKIPNRLGISRNQFINKEENNNNQKNDNNDQEEANSDILDAKLDGLKEILLVSASKHIIN